MPWAEKAKLTRDQLAQLREAKRALGIVACSRHYRFTPQSLGKRVQRIEQSRGRDNVRAV